MVINIMGEYILKCSHPECNASYDDTDFRLICDNEVKGKHGPSLLKAEYTSDRLTVRENLPGIFQYNDWLPTGDYFISKFKFDLGRPFCYKSSGLAKWLGLNKLYIAFSGFWPQFGPNLITRSFKEFEAQCTYARYLNIYQNEEPKPFIISSAGNTANGFNLISSLLNIPIYLVVPEAGLENLVLPFHTNPHVLVVKGDYTDAINVADSIAKQTGLMREGGARNVARRSGMGTAMLNAVAHPAQGSGFIFDHYFQAIGSGTGAIAAWEAVQLLIKDGRYGKVPTRIHIAQNSPFTPVVDSWENKRNKIADMDEASAKRDIEAVTAHVLTNRKPPYEITCGLYDVLKESNGTAYRVNNGQVFESARKFREKEGIDIGPASAVAVHSLAQAVKNGTVVRDSSVLLHITGGGRECQSFMGETYGVDPMLTIYPDEIDKAVSAIGEIKSISNINDSLSKVTHR
jgi:cysteate synthase